jgi:hypothetical protein
VLLCDQKLEKLVVVLARVENVLTAVPARDHMVKPALDLDPGFSWHRLSTRGIIPGTAENRNIASLTPIFSSPTSISHKDFTCVSPTMSVKLQPILVVARGICSAYPLQKYLVQEKKF